MEIQFKKHVRIICDLEIGDMVITEGYSKLMDSEARRILEVIPAIGKCESGFLVKVEVNVADLILDSGWFNKVNT